MLFVKLHFPAVRVSHSVWSLALLPHTGCSGVGWGLLGWDNSGQWYPTMLGAWEVCIWAGGGESQEPVFDGAASIWEDRKFWMVMTVAWCECSLPLNCVL